MKNVGELSGGQKQLLNLAAVMAMQPDILVLDEPTSQLDPLAAGDFFATLRKINAELGTSIVLIEHRLEEVLSYADRVMVMEDGKILALGAAKGIWRNRFAGTTCSRRCRSPCGSMMPLGGTGDCPVTVREGREWLQNIPCPAASKEPEADVRMPAGREKKEGNYMIEVRDTWFRYEKNLPDVVRDLNLQVKKG